MVKREQGEIHKVGDLPGYDPKYIRMVAYIFDAIGKHSKSKMTAQQRVTDYRWPQFAASGQR